VFLLERDQDVKSYVVPSDPELWIVGRFVAALRYQVEKLIGQRATANSTDTQAQPINAP